MDVELLEREPFLELLRNELAAVEETGTGRLVLVTGEAGAGKTALLQRFCTDVGCRCLSGACDALFTPRALGPFVDVAERVGGPLQELIHRSPLPRDVLGAVFSELRRDPPTLLILEDLHWADDATLDLLRLLGRRIDDAPALVLASLRDDELDRTHPLRIVLGELATSANIRRLRLPPLSLEAVRRLAEPRGFDSHEVYAQTGGNPFYVTELFDADPGEIPASVYDAVLARAARLGPDARGMLEAVAVVPPHAELWLLEAIAADALPHLEEIFASGMCRQERDVVAFRHELARVALEESIAPDRRLSLHRAALRALIDPPRGTPDPARVAHHAEMAGDVEAVLVFAPAAAARASRLHAHREAAAQYARALRFADGISLDRRASLLAERSHACYMGEQLEAALKAGVDALEHHRELGDPLRLGDGLRWVSRLYWCVGRTADAKAAAGQAVELLEPLPPGRELAMAYSNVAALWMHNEEYEAAVEWGTKAMELARQLADPGTLAHALTNVGYSRFLLGEQRGRADLERAIAIAAEAGLEEHVVRGSSNLGAAAVELRQYAAADRWLEQSIDHIAELGVSYWRGYPLAMRARSAFEQGRWDDAVGFAEPALARPLGFPLARLIALVVLGRVRARRGDPGVRPALDEALAIAAPTRELQQIAPVAAARAEASLLAGDADAVGAVTEEAFQLARLRRSPWTLGELACLRRRAGIEEPVPEWIAEPYALELAGDWPASAARWEQIGCRYEAAEALAASGGEEALRRAHAELELLGARPAASVVARTLRALVARGPRAATAQNPANLTPREVEVLSLIAQGLRNADIAQRLVVSQRTVDHHVSAILRKLGVRSRAEAGVAAVRLGIAADTSIAAR